MKALIILSLSVLLLWLQALCPSFAQADSRYDNQGKHYHLQPQLSAAADAQRGMRMELMDKHPSGLYVDVGETLRFDVSGLPGGCDALMLMVGAPYQFYDEDAEEREYLAHPGHNEFTSKREGLLYFRYVRGEGCPAALAPIDVQVSEGGTVAPFYIAGQTGLATWQHLLESSHSPYVQMVGRRAIITVRRDLFDQSQQSDPALALAYLAKVIRYHDAISGLDGRAASDQPSSLRIHYVQDDRPHAADSNVFMYAADGYVGMPDDSALVLLDDPANNDAWAIWHETGHLYQQADWMWDTVVEVTVNIYSLHAQESFGLALRVDVPDPDTGRTHWDWAEDYLAQPDRNFNDDASYPEDSSGWARLIMFEQLREGLGQEFYPALHKYYRLHPLTAAQRASQDTMIQQFVLRSSIAAQQDLTAFFDAWGLPVDDETARKIDALQLLPASESLLEH